MNKYIEYQYFGSIIYIKNICNASALFFDNNERYKKSTLRNKIVIPTANGILELSIPIKGGRDTKAKMKEVAIDYTNNWQAKHFKTLVATYSNSAWFQFYELKLKKLFEQQPFTLVEWNKLCLQLVFEMLKINVIMADENGIVQNIEANNILDLRGKYDKTMNIDNHLLPKYFQVFEEKIGFQPNMCILDLIFAEGNNAKNMLLN